MSVVLVTPGRFSQLRKTVSLLSAQPVSGALEIVIASPGVLLDAQDACLARFHSIQLVTTGPFLSTGHPRAMAVARCSAPIVAFAEDHCFPGPDWAETLIRLHGEEWAAVSPAMGNANPGQVSWADMLLNFGPSVHPVPSGATTHAPWHNTSYRRDFLCSHGDRLPLMLEAEVRLQENLLRHGHRIYLAGSTQVSHVNLSRWRSFLAGQMLGGRLYGSARAEASQWNVPRRLLYAAAFPLIPVRRAAAVLRDAKRTMPAGRSLGFLMACAAGLLASALGECAGYAFGAGSVGRQRIGYEYNRVRHVRSADRSLLS